MKFEESERERVGLQHEVNTLRQELKESKGKTGEELLGEVRRSESRSDEIR